MQSIFRRTTEINLIFVSQIESVSPSYITFIFIKKNSKIVLEKTRRKDSQRGSGHKIKYKRSIILSSQRAHHYSEF